MTQATLEVNAIGWSLEESDMSPFFGTAKTKAKFPRYLKKSILHLVEIWLKTIYSIAGWISQKGKDGRVGCVSKPNIINFG